MSFGIEDIVRQLHLGEDKFWEFKRIEFRGGMPSSPRRNDWADEIAAFANADGGGMLCGIADDGTPQDLTRAQIVALDSFLVEVCTDAVRPPVRPDLRHVALPSGERILLLQVPRGESQHDSPGGSYIRVGASKRRMTHEERLRLAQRREQARSHWFDEQIVPNTGPGTLKESLWKPLLSTEGAMNPDSALRKVALLAFDEVGIERATVAGVLFCTQNPEQWLPNASIMATRYRGTDRASGQIDAQEIVGPLDRQIADAVAFAIRNMSVAARKELGRIDMPQYSAKALFEAIVNAVAHRDYSIRGSRLRISIFEDRLEIQSPGALPNNLAVDSMEVRQATRNQTLSSLLGRMSVGEIRGSEDRRYFMERRGDGVPIIMRETRALCGQSPKYRVIDDSEVLLVIPAAPQETLPTRVVIAVHSDELPVVGADLVVLYPNKTWKRATTDQSGEAVVDLHTNALPMTVLVAAPGRGARVVREWLPSRGELLIELSALAEGGAAIFTDRTGGLPGFRGRLQPVRDNHDRTSLFAYDATINQGMPQPVYFALGEDLRLTDANGVELSVRIMAIEGRAALLEYRPYAEREWKRPA